MGIPAKDGLSRQEWIAIHQGKHFCQCRSCHGMTPIIIKGWHKFSPRGIPRYIRGHYKGPWSERIMPDGIRKKCGKARKGKKMSEEAKHRIALAMTGRSISAAGRLRISQSKIGKSWGQHTEEMKQHFSEIRTGSKSPAWKGGITDLRKIERAKRPYRMWRTNVFQRDGYKCRMSNCSTISTYIEAHHIKPFTKYPTLRYDVQNGITLCRPHHARTIRRESHFESMFYQILDIKKEESRGV